MKKTSPKLRLNRETLAGLEGVAGGAVTTISGGGQATCAAYSCINQCTVHPFSYTCPSGISCAGLC